MGASCCVRKSSVLIPLEFIEMGSETIKKAKIKNLTQKHRLKDN